MRFAFCVAYVSISISFFQPPFFKNRKGFDPITIYNIAAISVSGFTFSSRRCHVSNRIQQKLNPEFTVKLAASWLCFLWHWWVTGAQTLPVSSIFWVLLALFLLLWHVVLLQTVWTLPSQDSWQQYFINCEVMSADYTLYTLYTHYLTTCWDVLVNAGE